MNQLTKFSFQIGFACIALNASAIETEKGVFVDALVNKTATAPISSFPAIEASVREIQASTGNASPLEIRAQLLRRFSEQPKCGRVAFAVTQPATKTFWPQMGGQLNICEDGLPPLRMCPDRPSVLVPPNSKCANGHIAQDTPEVAKAIESALKSGNITSEQASKLNPKVKTP